MGARAYHAHARGGCRRSVGRRVLSLWPGSGRPSPTTLPTPPFSTHFRRSFSGSSATRCSQQRSIRYLGEPPIFQSIHQTEFFGTDPTATLPAGLFQVDNEVITDAFGPASAELLVTSSAEGTSAPPVGSVYDVINIGSGFENLYSDIAPTTPGGADTLSDTLVTPFGNIPITTRLARVLGPLGLVLPLRPTDGSIGRRLRERHHQRLLLFRPILPGFLWVRAECVAAFNGH